MPRPNLIGASNRYTNKTGVFGSLAGLAPTTGVRPHVTGIHGYKFTKVAANGLKFIDGGKDIWVSKTDYEKGCGFNRDHHNPSAPNGNACIKHIGYSKNIVQYRRGGTNKMGMN